MTSPTLNRTALYDVTTLGELVIDLLPAPSAGGLSFEAKPGGAPGNVAAGVARLGFRTAMITKVGDETFGRAAAAALAEAGVAVEGVVLSPAHHTALAVVSRNEAGDASYIFYRENCADSNLTVDDLPLDLIAASRVLHVGTLLLATQRSAAAQRHALNVAKGQGVLISTDMNFRRSFWQDAEAMRSAGRERVRAASIAKVSRDELALMADAGELADGVRSLWHDGMIAFAVTCGSEGAWLFTAESHVFVPAFSIDPVDTIGCGDAFMASLLAGLLQARGLPPAPELLPTIATRASAAGALMALRRGALENMPTSREIDTFLAERS